MTFGAYPTHENIQVVTKASFATYLVKYAAKVESAGKVSNPLDTMEKSQLPRDGAGQRGLQSVNQKQLPYIWARKIAMSEATLILSGQPLCLKSRDYIWLDTRLPPLRRAVVQRPDQGAPGRGQGGVVDGMIENTASASRVCRGLPTCPTTTALRSALTASSTTSSGLSGR